VTAPPGNDEYWPDEHHRMPAPWWRMPDDIRLQVRIRHSEIPDLLLSSDLYDSLSVHGPLYVNLAHLTRWDTYQHGGQPTRTAHRALTGQFPGQFDTIHHTNQPGTVSLALRLHRLTDTVADAIFAHRHTTLTALGLDPTSPFLLRMP